MVIGAGALQPDAVRQVATPLPWLPPMPMAIFTMEGITAMHLASLITLSGIALSGVAIISFRTVADASRRLSISDRSLSSADHARPTQSKRPAPSTRKYLGNAQLILVIIRPLPCSH